MPYWLYGRDSQTNQPTDPFFSEEGSEEAARTEAAAQGMIVESIERHIEREGSEKSSTSPALSRVASPSSRADHEQFRRYRHLATVAAALVVAALWVVAGVRVWRWATRQELFTLQGDTGPVFCVAFSPDGERLATAAARIGLAGSKPEGPVPLITLWNSSTGQEIQSIEMGEAGAAFCVAFSPNGKRMAVGSSNREAPAKVFGPSTSREVLVLQGHTEDVRSVAFSPDGKRVATGGTDGTVRIWDVESGKELLALARQGGWIDSVAFSPEGKRLATCTHEGTVQLWDATSGQGLRTLKHGQNQVYAMNDLSNVAFSPDGQRVAAAPWSSQRPKNTVQVWDAGSGRELFVLDGDCVAFSPDGTRLATGNDRIVNVWDAATGRKRLTLKGHTAFVYSVAFSPDSKRLASGSADRTVKVWQVAK